MQINPLKILKSISFERLAGTEGEVKAAEIILSYLKKLNLSYMLEEFEINTFKPGTGILEVDNKTIEVLPFGLNESCDVKGEMIYIEDFDVLVQNKISFKNKIILINGYNRTILDAVKKQQVAAMIIIGSPMRKASNLSHRQSSYLNGYIDSATISYKDALRVFKNSGKTARLIINQEVFKNKARNIIVEIEGHQPDGNLTYAVAHYDSVARTQGATDNAGGTVSLIKIAEYFSKYRPMRDLKMIFFSGEELGLLGSQNYVEIHQDEINERAGLVVNIDVTGDPIAKNNIIVTGSKELLGYSQGVTREAGYSINHSLDIYSSDQMPFVRYEVPAVSFARSFGQGSFFIHTADDKEIYVTSEGLNKPISASTELIKRVLNSLVYPVNKEIDSSLKEKIEKYFWTLTYEEPILFWTPKHKK